MIQQEGASEGQGMGARQGRRSVDPQGKLQEKMVLAPGWRQVCSTEPHAKNPTWLGGGATCGHDSALGVIWGSKTPVGPSARQALALLMPNLKTLHALGPRNSTSRKGHSKGGKTCKMQEDLATLLFIAVVS